MKIRALRGEVSSSLQRGFAMIALLALAALIASFLIASALSLTSAGISNERQDRSMIALRQAKAALIAYAANEQWQAYKGQQTDQPGALPCPDNNDTGASSGVCAGAANRVGRLPWATIGSNDFRDASGERLWYAVSSTFYKNSANVINSDTQGTLNVTGDAPASNVVAIVFAPGEALAGQDRIAQHNNPAAYLEGFNTTTSPDYTFNSVATPSSAANDRLLVITQAELMAVVEPVVAARIERDIKPLVQTYFNKWGAYPFPVPFGAGPPAAQTSYLGVAPTPPAPLSPPFTHGLLPLKNDASFTWASAAVTQLVGHPMQTGSPNVTSSSCSINTSPSQAVCQVNYQMDSNDRPVVVLEIFLGNANTVFVDTPSGATPPDGITMVDSGGDPLVSGAYGQWSFVAPIFPPTMSFVARPTGGSLTYVGRLQPAGSVGHRITITVPLPSAVTNYLPIVSSNPGPGGVNPNPNGAWFILNQWYKQTYYAVSPGYLPGGVPLNTPAGCSPLPATPSCLKVNNLPSPSDNKGVILVLAGRSLNNSSRPSSAIVNYLEGANLTAANDSPPYIYEHRAGTPTAINDRVVVVSP